MKYFLYFSKREVLLKVGHFEIVIIPMMSNLIHVLQLCIYLICIAIVYIWHQDFILVYFILKVSFTFLKIKPASYEKIKRRNPQAVLDPAMDEQPILFYTEQFNFLKSEDRKTIFKALFTMRMMDIKSWDYWQ